MFTTQLLSNTWLFSMLKNMDSTREPILNCANMSCQQLSRSSEWVIVGHCTCGGGDGIETPEAMALSITTCATAGTEGDSAQMCTSRVESDLLPVPTEKLGVTMRGNEGPLILHGWASGAQGDPWNPFVVTAKIPNNELEVGAAPECHGDMADN